MRVGRERERGEREDETGERWKREVIGVEMKRREMGREESGGEEREGMGN